MAAEKKPPVIPQSQQIAILMHKLEGVRSTRDAPLYTNVMGYVKELPPSARPSDLITALSKTFGVPQEDILLELDPQVRRKDFESLVPAEGWLRDYVEATRGFEPPTVFHYFVGMTTLGVSLARNVSYDLGFAHIFPNMRVLLIAPSGKCKKTSCCDLGVAFYRNIGGTILADKITPEALVDAFSEKVSATGLIYAGELAQFLGKQKYMEGMIPLLTRLFDCPQVWSSATIARKEVVLRNVAFSMLGASTMDWLRTGIPSDSFNGGFMSRFLFVVQEETPRSFPRPHPMPQMLKLKLLKRLTDVTHLRGTFQMTPGAERFYDSWYNSYDLRGSEDKQFGGYFERKPEWLLRIAMLNTVSVEDALVLERRTLERALDILNWVEGWLPGAFDQLSTTSVGEDHARLIRQLKKAGGELAYSDWLRKNSSRMKATEFRDRLETLRQAKLIDFDAARKLWYLTVEGWH